uniref:Uncharacterized protein n=1 Tax=Rhizophora mucronata TaxID=61149 RepID=A0A2P2PK82_RHIMU
MVIAFHILFSKAASKVIVMLSNLLYTGRGVT